MRTIEHFDKYFYGQQCHLRTDNSALTMLMSFKNLRDNPPPGFSAYKSTISLPGTVKPENTIMPMLFPDDCTENKVPNATKSRRGHT
jgi:hypothetical protein